MIYFFSTEPNACLAFHGGKDPHTYCFDRHGHDFAVGFSLHMSNASFLFKQNTEAPRLGSTTACYRDETSPDPWHVLKCLLENGSLVSTLRWMRAAISAFHQGLAKTITLVILL